MVNKIIVGSKNRTKVDAVKEAFNSEVNVIGLDVPSGVSAQPFSDEETLNGAINRAKAALKQGAGDIGIGLEGGVVQTDKGLVLCNWGALYTKAELLVTAGGARIFLPNEIALGLASGQELATVMDEYTEKENVRSNEGAIGIFTNSRMNRKQMFKHVVDLLVGQYEYYSRR